LVRHTGIFGGLKVKTFRGFNDVDRFFSKLDLRDIKIDPFKTSYPPDAEEMDMTESEVAVETEVIDRPFASTRQPHTPAWAVESRTSVVQEEAPLILDDDESFPLPGNGHLATVAAAEVVDHRQGDVLKVSARSRPSAVAGAIAGVVRESGRAEVQAIGAGATNQAVKAVAIARDYLRETGIEAVCLPAFIDVTIDNEDRTAIRLVVEPR
jgi:stage V sporulation protein S